MFIEIAGEVHRIILKAEGGAWIISYEHPCTPKFVSEQDLKAYSRIEPPQEYLEYIDKQKNPTDGQQKRLSLITELMEDEIYIMDRLARNQKIRELSEREGTTVKRIQKLYFRHLAGRSLVEERKPPEKQETLEQKDFRWAVDTFYYSAKKMSLRSAYDMMLLSRYTDANGRLIEDHPSWHSLNFPIRPSMGRFFRMNPIFAPCPYKTKKAVEVIDTETGQVKWDIHGKPMREEKEITYASFKAISIFDYSQTEGKPLPELAQELQGKIPDYMILIDSIKEIAPVPIRFESWDKSKKGHYDLANKEIVIKSGMSELQTVKTAIHETAHSILHKDKEHLKDSATMEVEAESIAFICCLHLGLDTSDYSFGYLAGWSSDKELPELKSSLQTIQRTAHELIEDLDRAILKHTNNLDISLTVADETLKIPSIADTKSVCHHRR